MSTRTTPALRSLAGAHAGETLQVQRILFGALRAHCKAMELQEGDVVHCRNASAHRLILETRSGRIVALDRDWARFIQVGRTR
jgi:hypothetical protein